MTSLALVSFLWGFSFVVIKGSLGDLDSNFVSFVRLLLSFAVFAPLIRVARVPRRDRFRFVFIGAVQFGFMYVSYLAAYRSLPAHAIALLTTTTPLFVSIFSDCYARAFHRVFLLAALLAVAGGAVLEYPDQPLAASLHGIALVQLSNAAFAFGQIAYKQLMVANPGVTDANVFGLLYGGAVVVTGSLSLFTTDYARLIVRPGQWGSLAYLGLVASGLGFFLWNAGGRKVNEGALAAMNNLKIPVGVVASLLILHEKADGGRLLAGCACLAAALWLNERFRGGFRGRPVDGLRRGS